MVRIKHRYLLFNILYPSSPSSTTPLNPSNNTSTKLPPSYLSIHRPTSSHVTAHHLLSTLRHTIATLFGDYGSGQTQSSLKIVYFSPATSTCILRCPRAHFRLVWASLTFMDSLPGDAPGNRARIPCVIQVVRVSGTIRKSEEELLRRARRDVVRAKLEGNSEEALLLEGLVCTGGSGAFKGGKGRLSETPTDSNVGEGGIEDFGEEDEDEMDDSDG